MDSEADYDASPLLDGQVRLSARDINPKNRPFRYSPLDLSRRSIRLLNIHRGLSSGGHVRCELIDADVGYGYTCLSYVWGQPDKGYPVVINDRIALVRKNLWHFLQHARKKKLGWLWIDAMCIDQKNLAERTHQVQQMGEVYSQARVISWLGTSPEIVDLLHGISNKSSMDGYQTAMEAFYAHEYWTRAWVTQEVASASKLILMAGGEELAIGSFPAHISFAQVPYHLARVALFLSKARNWFNNKSLIWLLDMMCAQECEIPHDRIFPLLALCGEGRDLRVNYQASLEEIVWRTCNCCAFCFCSLQIVSHALLSHKNRFWRLDQSTSVSSEILRMRHGEVRTEDIYQRENYIFFANPGPCDLSRFIRMNEAFLEEKQRTPYTRSYFIPISWICAKYAGGPVKWFLALCVCPDQAGLDYYHLPAEFSIPADGDAESKLFDTALKSEIRHWPEDLKMIYEKPNLGTIRLSLAFWIELAKSPEWTASGFTGYCRLAKEERGGLKLSTPRKRGSKKVQRHNPIVEKLLGVS
jgi:hypothetical protein